MLQIPRSPAISATSSYLADRNTEYFARLRRLLIAVQALAALTMTDTIHFWHAPDLGADLLRARFDNFSYDLHTHATACFALITGGAIRIRMRGGETVARTGDLYAINPEEPHAGWPVDKGGWSQRTLYVDLGQLASRLSDAGSSRATMSVRGPIIRDATLANSFSRLHLHSENNGSQLERDHLLLAFARHLFDRHVSHASLDARAASESKAIRIAKEYLDRHLDERVGLADLAAAVDLPAYRFYRAFERETGMTPHGYQRQARVRAAQRLLRDGGQLSEIAAATGFADQAHFTRSFRSRMGITPGAYRSALHAII
jgi:AraC-like DNA-binding protein